MADRIIGMRAALRECLEKRGSPLSWQHITNQVHLILCMINSCVHYVSFPVLFDLLCFSHKSCDAFADWHVLLYWVDTGTG